MRDEIATLESRIPPNSEILMKTVKAMEHVLKAKQLDDNVKFNQLEKDTEMLKKRQNLSDLEHRLCDRIDDVCRVLSRTMAEKFDMNKRFRVVENRIQSLLELSVLITDPDSVEELRRVIAS